MKKIIFIFSGERKRLLKEIGSGQAPDTQLYGMNHLASDFDVESKEFGDTFLGDTVGKLLGFRLRHFLMYFWVRTADIVFGSSLYYMLPLRKLFGAKGKFVLLNMSLNRFLNENAKNSLVYAIIKFFLKSADKIVSLSHLQQNELRERHGVPKKKLAFLPLGVDISFYKPIFSGRKKYILSAGRDNGRDYKTVIDVARQMPDAEFHLVLAKRNLVGITNIPENVKLFFNLSKKEMRDKYAEAALQLLITHADGFGDGADCSGQTVLLDSFASGLPVIASRKGYIEDYAIDGEHLLLVDFYDVSVIIEAIATILKEGESERLGRNARTLVEKEFSTKRMGERLSEAFKEVSEK